MKIQAKILSMLNPSGNDKAASVTVGIVITDPEMIAQILGERKLNLYTEEEVVDLKARIKAALKTVNRMTTGNLAHHVGNLKAILGGIK